MPAASIMTASDETDGSRLARDLAPWIAGLSLARQVLAIRARDRTEEA